MTNTALRKMIACACVLVLALGAFVGCANGPTASQEAQKANRAYMSQVNQTMEELGDNLDKFIDAVSRGDIVTMRTQADNAYKTLDKLAGIEAPEGLEDIQSGYVEGTGKLREALDSYIALYAEMDSASQAGTLDVGAYADRIAEVQSVYDEGVAALKAADEAAAEKE